MNIKKVISKVTDRWLAKIICFVIALLLYIFQQTTKVEKRTIVVPLEVIQDGNVTYTGHVAKNVSILIRAKDEEINTIQPTEISASLNLNFIAKSGDYEVPIDITLADRLLAMDPLEIKVKPERVTLHAEERVLKYVEVKPQIVEEVGHGYVIEKIICTPPYVEIMGPKSLIEGIDSISTKRIPVSNATSSFTTETSYYEINKLIDVPFKGPYKVTVAVSPETTVQVFNNVPVKPINLSENLLLTETRYNGNLAPVNITVEGNLLFLEKYNLPSNALVVNLADITEPGTYEVPIISHISNSLSIKEISKDKITINVVAVEEESAETNATDSSDLNNENPVNKESDSKNQANKTKIDNIQIENPGNLSS